MPGAVESAEADAAAAAAAAAAVRHRRPTAAERRRMYRDLALSLRCGLRDAAAGFSFLRLRGLRALLRALRSVADAGADAGPFRDSQSIRDLQGKVPTSSRSRLAVVPALLPLPSSPLVTRADGTGFCSDPGAVRAQPAQGGGDRGRGRSADGGAGAGHGARRGQAQEPRHGLQGRARAQGARRLLPPLPGLRRRGAPLQCRQGTYGLTIISVLLLHLCICIRSELFVHQQCNAMQCPTFVLLACPACLYYC